MSKQAKQSDLTCFAAFLPLVPVLMVTSYGLACMSYLTANLKLLFVIEMILLPLQNSRPVLMLQM